MAVTFNLYNTGVTGDAQLFQKTLVQRGNHTAKPTSALCNSGLRFTKFFGRWSTTDALTTLKDLPGNGKTDPLLDWLDPHTTPGTRQKGEPVELKVGDERLGQACKRQQELAEAKRGVCFDLELDSRLLTGIGLPHPTESGFLFHPTLAVPYIRGTALKQVAHDWAEEIGQDKQRIAKLFGAVDGNTPKAAGMLAFLDALPLSPATLTAEQITPHYGPYYEKNPATELYRTDTQRPADWYDPVPVTLLAVEPRVSFRFVILPLSRVNEKVSPDELKKARDWITEGLSWNGVGAKTTLGFGRFKKQAVKAAWQPQVGARVLVVGRTGTVLAIDQEKKTARIKLDPRAGQRQSEIWERALSQVKPPMGA